ncbi:MAG TPA: PepSY-associated TM helix domain-containing protein [Vicinamibacterales bacterium]|jgi:uncharacterized iron-regulated membrane protein
MALRRVRAFLFWSHLTAGVLAGIVILVMSATGAILALKPQIVDRIDRVVRSVQPDSASRLPPSLMLAVARAVKPDATPTSITIDRDPSSAVSVSMGRAGTIYLNPYTAAVLGSGSDRTAAFFRSVEDWHRWLAVSGENRQAGRAVTGAANLAFLVLGLTGLYIWWPRRWTPQHTSPILLFRRAQTGRARDFNWHNVIGFWCAPAIIIMTFSGVVMSYPWANNLLYRALGSTPPSQSGDRGGASGGPAGQSGSREAAEREQSDARVGDQIDAMWALAERQLPTWETMTARFPNRAGAPIVFSISDGASWNRFARSQLTLDSTSGEIRQWQPYEASSLGQKARGWLRFAHTGELGGLPGQFVAGIGCLGGVVLVWTGLSLAIRRFLNWKVWTRVPAGTGADWEGAR